MQRIYVIDFKEFVKIGITNDIERRLSQLPYKGSTRFHCTDKVDNARRIEKIMHIIFDKERKLDAKGREYFSITFEKAVDALEMVIQYLSENPSINDYRLVQEIKLIQTVDQMPEYLQNRFLGFMIGFKRSG